MGIQYIHVGRGKEYDELRGTTRRQQTKKYCCRRTDKPARTPQVSTPAPYKALRGLLSDFQFKLKKH